MTTGDIGVPPRSGPVGPGPVRIGVDLISVGGARAEAAAAALMDTLEAWSPTSGSEPVEAASVELTLLCGPSLLQERPALVERFEHQVARVSPGPGVLGSVLHSSWLRSAVRHHRLHAIHGMTRRAGGAGIPWLWSLADAKDLARAPGATVVVPSARVAEQVAIRRGLDARTADIGDVFVVPWPAPGPVEEAPIELIHARYGIIGRVLLVPIETATIEDLLTVARSMYHLANRHYELTLVLVGPERSDEPRLAATLEELGLSQRVVRIRQSSAAVRGALLSHATVVVFGVRDEGHPHEVLEALARGVPVVCLDAGPAPDLAGAAGPRVSPGDEVQLAVEVNRVVEDREWRRRSAAAGRARAQSFSPERSAEALLAAYRSVLVSL